MTTKNIYKEFDLINGLELRKFIHDNIHYAFGKKQFQELMQRLGCKDLDELKNKYTLFYGGGIIARDKVAEYNRISDERHKKQIAWIKEDMNHAYEAFLYEMYNHECGYTGQYEIALQALGLTKDDLNNDKNLMEAYNKAKKEVFETTD